MIGIYKITNKINQHSYIGQSRNIEKRWNSHIQAANNENNDCYNYPLQQAFRKYGITSFEFSILSECPISELDNQELYWINYFNPEYNQTFGGNQTITHSKLTEKEVNEIKQILKNDVEGQISHKELAEKYNVSKDTIRDINVGRSWYDDTLIYPLHYSKFSQKPVEYQKKWLCIDCGKEISKGASRCLDCENKYRRQNSKKPVSREELKKLIRHKSFCEIGRQFNVTDNSIRKWCDFYSLPRTKREIEKYTIEEWENI